MVESKMNDEIIFIDTSGIPENPTTPEKSKPYRHNTFYTRFFQNNESTRRSAPKRKCKLCGEPTKIYLEWRHLYRNHRHVFHPEEGIKFIFGDNTK